MDPQMHNRFLHVISDTLEQFAFMFVDEEPDKVFHPERMLSATIRFEGGGGKGLVMLATSEALCGQLAENALGIEGESLPEGATANALEELANIACGELAARTFGADEDCRLGIPESKRMRKKDWKAMSRSSRTIALEVEGEPFLAQLKLPGT